MNKIEIQEPFNNIQVLKDDIYEYCEIKNVATIESRYNKYIIELDDDKDSIYYYLIIDTVHQDAFGHWVFESGIYLPLFFKIKQKYPLLKLYLSTFKMYKKLFCNYFDINDHDIVYTLEKNNTCILPLPISSLNINTLNENWKLQVEYFFNIMPRVNKKTTTTVFLPRQHKENYNGNNRNYNTADIVDHIDLIVHTDEINCLNDQINKVNSSSNVILTGGSPYFVNGLFCNNSNIIVLDDFIIQQMDSYIKLKYIHDKICELNIVHFIKHSDIFYYDQIKTYLK